jgi:hypothetical protein
MTRTRWFAVPSCAVLVLFGGAGSGVAQSLTKTGIAELDPATLGEALTLLPRRPERVVVIDCEQARPEVRPHLIRLDAFVTRGGRVIYLVKQSAVVQLAEKRHPVALGILAAIIWHEMAHLEGEGEAVAQQREEDLWTRIIRDQRVDPITGLRYLRLLRERPHPTPPVQQLARDLEETLGR